MEKISQFCSRRTHGDIDSRCVQISRKSAAGKWVKRCVVLVTKRSQNAVFFAAILRRLAEGAKCFYWGAYHLSRRVHVKFRPNRFRVARVLSVKVISYNCNTCICLRHTIRPVIFVSGQSCSKTKAKGDHTNSYRDSNRYGPVGLRCSRSCRR